ncbi:MAG: hypothetical protein GEU80_12025 [Dehalococcoidia bacterium]|nr:hypothetical protein [Dehalococcoidia bacterium]
MHDDSDVIGFFRAALIFTIVWWGWSQFTWTCNGIDIGDRLAGGAVLLATIPAFFMAQGLPDAFTADGEWFSVPFGTMLAIGLGLYWWGLRDEEEHQRALVTYLPVAAFGGALAVSSGSLDADLQEWGYGATIATFLMAGIASQFGTPFHVHPKHFAERHGLVVIIALGESIIAVGIGAAELERTAEFALAVGAGAAGVCLLWWSYFDWFQRATERAIRMAEPHGRASLARDAYTFAHFPIVLGVVGIAVATEETIAHPSVPLEGFAQFALAAGVLLYLLGIVAGHLRATGELLIERVVAAAFTIPVAMVFELDAIVASIAIVAIHAVALTIERMRTPALFIAAE